MPGGGGSGGLNSLDTAQIVLAIVGGILAGAAAAAVPYFLL